MEQKYFINILLKKLNYRTNTLISNASNVIKSLMNIEMGVFLSIYSSTTQNTLVFLAPILLISPFDLLREMRMINGFDPLGPLCLLIPNMDCLV